MDCGLPLFIIVMAGDISLVAPERELGHILALRILQAFLALGLALEHLAQEPAIVLIRLRFCGAENLFHPGQGIAAKPLIPGVEFRQNRINMVVMDTPHHGAQGQAEVFIIRSIRHRQVGGHPHQQFMNNHPLGSKVNHPRYRQPT